MATIVGEYNRDDLVLNNAGVYEIGDLPVSGNGTRFKIDDVTRSAFISDVSGNMLTFDRIAGTYQIGDSGGFGNSSELFIDDANSVIVAFASSGFYVEGSSQLIGSNTALANGAGAAAGTLLNAPVAGDPTKWVQIDDNGTLRFIPCW